ncbi:MAG: DUF512 domain-containing protein [Selenomonadaceae bacterium]|nr:DUF512 domain-containing protein [Selenomonadaceae bacterium]
MYGRILKVYPGSLAEELELVPGDKLLEINGTKLRDIIDVSFAFADEEIEMLVEHEDGQQEVYEFDKDYDEELGVEFESAVFDGIRHCANNCLFCFVDQVAPDMRESLNIKDDDYRMSFLYGNFITMTNMVDADFQRIKQYHLSPLFVSVQCTNPDLRQKLLRCRTAGNLAAQLDKLEAADVEYHTQIVLCRDLNDGEELERSLRDMVARQPHALSVAIVPVGLTRFRQDRYPLKSFDKESAARVVEQVEAYQRQQRARDGRTFIYLADEFYLLAGRELPPAEYYDGFPQLDNGIGLARNFMEEFAAAVAEAEADGSAAEAAGGMNFAMANQQDRKEKQENQENWDNLVKLRLAVVSGTSISPLMAELAESVGQAGAQVTMVPVPNHHFGTTVNVSGLLTAKDMLAALHDVAGKVDGILIPESALRTGDNVFLDDVSLSDFCTRLPCRVETVGSGREYFHALTDWENYSGVEDKAASYMWQSNAAYTKRGGM